MFNWWKINSGDYSYLFKEKRSVKDKETSTILSIYRNLLSEYIQRIGLADSYKNILKKQKRIASLKLKFVISQDRKILTQIRLATEEMTAMIMNEGSADFNEVKAMVETNLGFRIDPRTTSVIEFDGYVKHLKNRIAS